MPIIMRSFVIPTYSSIQLLITDLVTGMSRPPGSQPYVRGLRSSTGAQFTGPANKKIK